MNTYELRAFIPEKEYAIKALQAVGATFKGEYSFIDNIYSPTSCTKSINLNTEFVRLRSYKKTMWIQKNFVLVHKQKNKPGVSGITLMHREFDTLAEAQQAIAYPLLFSFSRIGYEYSLNNIRIFVEEIQGLPTSIEIIAHNEQEIIDLFARVNATAIINDSVPKLIEKSLKI